ncbi:hypothetical protein LIER_22440 [Lithospermum erythrorhizon]|uniref:Uncharacterized protein n=1 Tax=Lithospermum erythrorhizon TaxID=34254 RepID=A0AAV3QX36_LITER
MALGVSAHGPSAGYPQQGYGHKEEYSKEDYYKDGNMHKEDYYKTDNYGNSSTVQMMRPHSSHSPSGPNHHGNGNGYGNSQHGPEGNGYGNSSFTSGVTSQHGPGSNGYGNSGYSSGIHSQHGSGNNIYGNNHGSHMPMGTSRSQDMNYGYQSQGQSSDRPYYQQQPNGSHSWISKDLDD